MRYRIVRTVDARAIDGLGHTNNTIYIGWCEQAAWEHSAALGLSLSDYQALGFAMAVTRAVFDYRKATYEGEILTIDTWLSSIEKRLRMKRHFRIASETTGLLVGEGEWDFACIRLSDGRPSRMPKEFVDVYSAAIVG